MEMQMEINAAEAGFETRLSALEDLISSLTAKLEEQSAKLDALAEKHSAKEVSASAITAPVAMPTARKTLSTQVSPQMTTLLAKQGVTLDANLTSIEAGALDQALTPLSIEQRIAVKAQLLRVGLLH